MIKRLSKLLICTVTIIALLAPTQLYAQDESAVHTSVPDFKRVPLKFAKMEKDRVDVYARPNLSTETIDHIGLGTYVRILQDEGGFYQVWLPATEQQGYISKNDVTIFDPSWNDTVNFHQVVAGDTLFHIADKYKTSLKALIQINYLTASSTIVEGQSLIVPKGTPDVSSEIPTEKIPARFTGFMKKTIYPFNPQDIKDHWAYTQLDDFLNAGILNGFENNGVVTLQPQKPITRAEFVTTIIRALGLEDAKLPGLNTFVDVRSDDWFYPFIQLASAHQIVNGINEDHFAPEQWIQRDEIAAIIVRAFGETVDFQEKTNSFKDVPHYWGTTFIDKASSVGIITGITDDSFKPSRYATRAEAVTMLYRALQLESSDWPTENLLVDDVTKELRDIDGYIKYGDSPAHSRQHTLLNSYIENQVTGYYQAYLFQQVRNFEALAEKHIAPDITLRGPMKVNVIHRSNRYASVEITGANYDVRLNGEVLGLEPYENFSLDSSGILLLKKTSVGTWKSYNFLPTNAESSHYIEGIIKQTGVILDKIK